MTVLLLCDFTTTQPGAGHADPDRRLPRPDALGAGRLEGRLASGAASDAGLAAEPFSSQAAALGWQELLPAGERAVSVKNCLLDPLACVTLGGGQGVDDSGHRQRGTRCASRSPTRRPSS